MEVSNEAAQDFKVAASEKPVVNEITKEKLLTEIKRAQDLTRMPLDIDNLYIDYGTNPFVGEYWSAGCYVDKGVKWAYINTGKSPGPEAKFLESPPNKDDFPRISHEITHIVTIEKINTSKCEAPVKDILGEGVSIMVELSALNANLPEEQKVNIEEVGKHCQRIVTENQNLYLIPDKNVPHNPYIGLTAPFRSQYDGFHDKRSLIHIAGISFVQATLGEEVWKLPVVLENPPTMDDIVHPENYKLRVGDQLNNFQKDKIEPKIPTFKPD